MTDPEAPSLGHPRNDDRHVWKIPVTQVVEGDEVVFMPTGRVYEVLAREVLEGPPLLYKFKARLLPEKSAATQRDVAPGATETDIVIEDLESSFLVMRADAPPTEYAMQTPS